MKKHYVLYLALLGMAIFNGWLSPISYLIFLWQGIWYPKLLPSPLYFMMVLSVVISSLLHLLATGIPAAMVEKMLRLNHTETAFAWLVSMAVPTVFTLNYIGWI